MGFAGEFFAFERLCSFPRSHGVTPADSRRRFEPVSSGTSCRRSPSGSGCGARTGSGHARRLRHDALVGLEDDPSDWRVTKDGQVLVSRGGRAVTTVRGAAAAKLIGGLGRADDDGAQQLPARVTGNYKRGNER